MQVKNRKGTSAWMLSFQNYLKAMSDHRRRHQLPEQIAQLKQLRSKAQPKATAMASASKSRSASTADEDWEKVTPNKSGHKNKREIEEPKGNTQTKMNMEPNKESRDDSDADCAERACPGDASTRGSVSASKRRPKKQKESTSPQLELLSESQVTMLHEEISKRMFEIQDSLSTIKQKHPAVASIHPEKVQYSRPADLMEIYCEKDSQITEQINRCGGNALRFTKEDGDLNTEEGVNKLWTWVEMYEPKHIWVAPECRL